MTAKIKTMIISSDPAMLRFLQQNLRADDYPIASTRYTGEELRTTLATECPDLIIVDIMMPGLDGIKVCLRIHQWSDAPIIMLSAWEAGRDKVRGLDLSTDSYLTEPFGIDEVMARISEALQGNFAAINFLPDISPSASLEG